MSPSMVSNRSALAFAEPPAGRPRLQRYLELGLVSPAMRSGHAIP